MSADSPVMLQAVVIDLASFLFHRKALAPATTSSHLSALKDPLLYGFGIVADYRALELTAACSSSAALFVAAKVIAKLQSPSFGASTSLECLFSKALLFVALAKGLRASQLCAQTPFPSNIQFSIHSRKEF